MESRCRDDAVGHIRKRFARNTSERRCHTEIERSNAERTVGLLEGRKQPVERSGRDSFLLD
jgi:hypothetical protein